MPEAENPNWCFVEDTDTQAATLALMRHHIPTWPPGPKGAPVFIKVDTEIHNLLRPATLKTEFQASGRKAMGIIVDAEQQKQSVWNRVLNFAVDRFTDVPADLPEDGLVLVDLEGRRFGIWVMPDNKSNGMLEDFLRTLVPDQAEQLWEHSVNSVATARSEFGAPCREIHLPKAHLHSWLAFQDPPGERIGVAIAKKFLDPASPSATIFVDWFKRLFQL